MHVAIRFIHSVVIFLPVTQVLFAAKVVLTRSYSFFLRNKGVAEGAWHCIVRGSGIIATIAVAVVLAKTADPGSDQ